MTEFLKGDKVRMLRSSEEGEVVKVSGNIIEIETTDGFVIPVVAADLAKVSREEEKFFRNQPVDYSKPKSAEESLFIHPFKDAVSLVFEEINEMKLRPWFINHFDAEVLFVLSVKDGKVFTNMASGQCGKGEEVRLDKEFKKSEFENWSKWHLQLLVFKKEKEVSLPMQLEFSLKASKLFKEKENFGKLQRKGYVRLIDLKEKQLEEPVKGNYFEPQFLYKEKTIDLHAGFLGIQENKPDLILEQQLAAFQKEFDNAIANDLTELTVIHGVGNGVLRTKIHKQLAISEHVEWFKDAQKEKFGYGATLVHFKA